MIRSKRGRALAVLVDREQYARYKEHSSRIARSELQKLLPQIERVGLDRRMIRKCGISRSRARSYSQSSSLAMRRPELLGIFGRTDLDRQARRADVDRRGGTGRAASCRRAERERLLAVAESGDAEFIATSDISLLQLGRHRGIRIVRPRGI